MTKSIALALGGGGARSLAQIAVVEVLDELGIKPVALTGASFGAVIAAAYASGMSGKDMRRTVIDLAHEQGNTWRGLLAARAATLSEWITSPLSNPLLLDPEKLCAQFLPEKIPEDFAALKIPLTIVATDLHARAAALLTSGPLKPAIASSIAVPGLMKPVLLGERVLVDGAAVNPLPFDLLRKKAAVVIAVDASVGPLAPGRVPDPWEALFATMHVIAHGIVNQKLREGEPDLLLRPNMTPFHLFDFMRASAILRAAEPMKAEFREKLKALL
ncbi:MAG: patatin-like phospholipase family protein [Pseudomonadota bacterium]